MAMKRCPVCGERYSDTYRNCPFCEEDALREDEEFRRSPSRSRRSARSRQYNLITPTLIVLIIIMASLLIYLLYGDEIAKKFGGEKDGETNNPPISDDITPQQPEITPPPAADGDTPEGGDGEDAQPGVIPDTPDANPSSPTTPNSPSTSEPAASGEMTYERAMALPGGGISLNKSDFTRSVSEGAYQLKATGGSGTLTWISEDPGIASVDSTGKVTPIAAGNTNILVTDGSQKAVCIVRVKGGGGSPAPAQPAAPDASGGSSTGSGGANTLNREDMTISVGETFRLKLSGVTTALSWSVADSGIATVGGDGTVTGVSKGMTTVTVSWDGQSRNCIVRVK